MADRRQNLPSLAAAQREIMEAVGKHVAVSFFMIASLICGVRFVAADSKPPTANNKPGPEPVLPAKAADVANSESGLWKDLVGKSAPALQVQNWLIGKPVSLDQRRGHWTILYFWVDRNCDQDLRGWMDVQRRFSDEDLMIIVVKPAWSKSLEEDKALFQTLAQEKLQGRSMPFRVAIDRLRPDQGAEVPFGTLGATVAAYQSAAGDSGVMLRSLALLIDPEGKVRKELSRYGSYQEVEAATGLRGKVPESESRFFKEYTLAKDEIVAHHTLPFSQARKDYCFYRFGSMSSWTMVLENEKLELANASTTRALPLETVVRSVVGLCNCDLEADEELLDKEIAGDWVFRKTAASDERVLALQSVLRQKLGLKLRFEKVRIRRSVVIVSGIWTRPKPEEGEDPRLVLTYQKDYSPRSGAAVLDSKYGGGGSGSFQTFLDELSNKTRFRFISEVKNPPRVRVSWRYAYGMSNGYVRPRRNEKVAREQLATLTANVAEQTGLKWRTEERERQVWRIVSE